MLRVEEVRAADAAEGAQRSAEVLVIASCHDPAASLPEARNSVTVSHGQPVALINRKQPELLKVSLIKRAKDRIIAGCICFAVARRHVV
jgi:hypothetical protein